MRSETPYDAVRLGSRMPGVRWFPGARLSYPEHILRGRVDDDVAIIDVREGDDGGVGGVPISREITVAELRAGIAAFARELTELGVRAGDRVVGYLPNIPEGVIALLGAAECRRRVVGMRSGVQLRRGRRTRRPARARGPRDGRRLPLRRAGARPSDGGGAAARGVDPVRATVLAERMARAPWTAPDRGRAYGRPTCSPRSRCPVNTRCGSSSPPERPGRPKGIVHSTGGVILEHLKTMGPPWTSARPTRSLWYTSPSWMVWNFLVSGTVVGAPASSPSTAAPPTQARMCCGASPRSTRSRCWAPALATCGHPAREGLCPRRGVRPHGPAHARLLRLGPASGGLSLGRRQRRGRGYASIRPRAEPTS